VAETRRQISGEFRHYVEFKAGAERFLKLQTEDPRQEYHNRLAALIFLAFAFEAFVNHVGAKKYPEWWEFVERTGFQSKVKLLCFHLGVKADFGARPFQTLLDCKNRRDELAHSKYYPFDLTVTIPEGVDSANCLFPEIERDYYANREFVERTLADLNHAIKLVLDAARLENENPDSLASSFGQPSMPKTL